MRDLYYEQYCLKEAQPHQPEDGLHCSCTLPDQDLFFYGCPDFKGFRTQTGQMSVSGLCPCLDLAAAVPLRQVQLHAGYRFKPQMSILRKIMSVNTQQGAYVGHISAGGGIGLYETSIKSLETRSFKKKAFLISSTAALLGKQVVLKVPCECCGSYFW